jgi:alpha/beta superfamily hydrolase
MTTAATSREEIPFFFGAAGEDVFGILTEPTAPPLGVAVVILSGGAFIGATNRNQLSVKLARRLSSLGFHAVRIDYHGVGESSGDFESYRLSEPFVDDVLGAVRWVEEHGVREFILVGTTCFGSRTALASAIEIERLRGLALFATPIRDFLDAKDPEATPAATYAKSLLSARKLRGLLDRERRRRYFWIVRTKARFAWKRLGNSRSPARRAEPDGMSGNFYGPLATLAGRQTPVLLAYGVDDDFYADFRAARDKPRLTQLFDEPGSTVAVKTLPGSIHGLRRIADQENVLALAEEWIAPLRDVPAAAAQLTSVG